MDTASLTVAPVHQNHRQQTVHTERDHSQPVRPREREGGRKGGKGGGREGRREGGTKRWGRKGRGRGGGGRNG